jgi:hypothetical protein
VLFFDLNCFAPPAEWKTAFDLINNEGAIEHLINPINGFQVAHELLKVGGVAVHSIPLSGHTNHGLMYPTIKFYNRLLGANAYELLLAEISIGPSQPLADERFVVLDRQGRPIARRVDLTTAWLRLAYRKTVLTEFRSPFSHWVDDQSGPLSDRVNADYAAFARYRLTERGGSAAVMVHGTGSVQPMQVVEDFSYQQRRELQIREHEHADALTRDQQRREHEHSDVLLAKLQQTEHEHSEVLAAKLQRSEHEHSDILLTKLQHSEHEHSDDLLAGLQRRDHEHADTLLAKIQQREHQHSNVLLTELQQWEDQRYLRGGGAYLPLLAISLTSLLNGGALLIGLSHGSAAPAWLFAAGLLSGFLPTVTAWTNVTVSPSPISRVARHGSRLLWLASVALFAGGCLAAGSA